MSTPVNLNHVRKAKAKAEKKAQADANAVKYGRSKAERLLEAARSEHAHRRLDQLKFEDEA